MRRVVKLVLLKEKYERKVTTGSMDTGIEKIDSGGFTITSTPEAEII